MKTLVTLVTCLFLCGNVFADETDASAEKSVEKSTSTNPLTGSKTTTRKYKKKSKSSAGAAEDTVTEKTKVSGDGQKTTTTTEATTSNEPNP